MSKGIFGRRLNNLRPFTVLTVPEVNLARFFTWWVRCAGADKEKIINETSETMTNAPAFPVAFVLLLRFRRVIVSICVHVSIFG